MELQFWGKGVDEEMVTAILRALWIRELLEAWRVHQLALISFSWSPQVHEQGRNTEKLVAHA